MIEIKETIQDKVRLVEEALLKVENPIKLFEIKLNWFFIANSFAEFNSSE